MQRAPYTACLSHREGVECREIKEFGEGKGTICRQHAASEGVVGEIHGLNAGR